MKKLLLLGLILLVLATITYFGYQSYKKIEEKKVFTEQVKHLPQLSLFQWIDSKPKMNKLPTIIMFFHPECEHCQYEAQTITKKQQAFSGINLWWISFADSSSIRAFSKDYHLVNQPNTSLAHLKAENVMKVFGSISVPHIFIYDKQKQLQKEFKQNIL